MNHHRLPLLGCLLGCALPMLAAAPPPEGLETDIAAGIERTSVFTGGDGETKWVYRYADLPLHVHVRNRWEGGLVVGGQLDVMPAFVSSADPVSEIVAGEDYTPSLYERGDVAVHAVFAGRVGWHGALFGAEAGMAIPGRPGLPDSPVFVLPTGMLWAGRQDLVYAWGRYLYGPTALDTASAGAMAGVGHNGEQARVLLGVGQLVGLVEGAVRVSEGVRLGALVTVPVDEDIKLKDGEIRGQLRVTIGHREFEERW
jgi:hypothetical protein